MAQLFFVDAKDATFAQKHIESTVGEVNAETIEIAISDSAFQLLTTLQDNRHIRPRIDQGPPVVRFRTSTLIRVSANPSF